jgi:hypothetical protein
MICSLTAYSYFNGTQICNKEAMNIPFVSGKVFVPGYIPDNQDGRKT